MKVLRTAFLFGLLVFIWSSCQQEANDTMFQLQSPKSCGIDFTNKVENTKDFNIFSYRNFYNGGGVAIGDINNDGLADVFFTSNMGTNKLYLNKGNFAFEDISAKAGIQCKDAWNTGVVFVDINADGLLDIYVCNAGYNKWRNDQHNNLFINNGDLTFTEQAKAYGLDEKGYTTHAAFFDYDLDGDLDCYILNNSFIPVSTLDYANKRSLPASEWPVKDFLKGGGDKLLRNDNGKFADVSKSANIYQSLIGFGLGVSISDVNGDRYPDIYVSNDFFERDYLYINKKDGTFSEEFEQWFEHTSLASMGADIADVNNDGWSDIFTTDMLPNDEYRLKTTASFDNFDVYKYKLKQGFYHQFQQNALQINTGNKHFMEAAYYSNVASSDWSWGALIFDADNDTNNDIYVCNGIYKDVIDQDFINFFANEIYQKMAMSGEKSEMQRIIDSMPSVPIPNKMFVNKTNFRFEDKSKDWGLGKPSFSNGAAYGDLDNDGDLDLVVNNVNMASFVYKNTLNDKQKTNYIHLKLKGNQQNTYAIGSLIHVHTPTKILTREVCPSRGFQSSTDYQLTIGLGSEAVDSIVIQWPNGHQSVIEKPAINATLQVDIEKTAHHSIPSHVDSDPKYFTSVANPVFKRHVENEHNDFYYERNIPVKLSTQGPHAAIADVNNDKLNDIFITGADGQASTLYFQRQDGSYIEAPQPDFVKDLESEDIAATFFDADGDRDLDLFVVAGGNHRHPHDVRLDHKLYLNNGNGKFAKTDTGLKRNHVNFSKVLAYDIDDDGDQDILAFGRNMSMNYGIFPSSFVYANDGLGHFQDVTTTYAPMFKNYGMVTDALIDNIIGDEKMELVVVGEWMGVDVFNFDKNGLKAVPTNLENLDGWWQTVGAADLDNDGKKDLILGNVGDNFYLKPSPEAPVKLWLNDFDNNAIVDKVFSKTVNGKDVPVFTKKEFTEALPSYKKQNLQHKAYAKQSIQTLFDKDKIQKATVRNFTHCKSLVAYNLGNTTFDLVELPVMAQWSSINAIQALDVNGDDKLDLILGGNFDLCLPQFGKLDANFGQVLLNEGQRKLSYLSPVSSGIQCRGVVRGIYPLANNQLLFLRNNEVPLVYQLNQKLHDKQAVAQPKTKR